MYLLECAYIAEAASLTSAPIGGPQARSLPKPAPWKLDTLIISIEWAWLAPPTTWQPTSVIRELDTVYEINFIAKKLLMR